MAIIWWWRNVWILFYSEAIRVVWDGKLIRPYLLGGTVDIMSCCLCVICFFLDERWALLRSLEHLYYGAMRFRFTVVSDPTHKWIRKGKQWARNNIRKINCKFLVLFEMSTLYFGKLFLPNGERWGGGEGGVLHWKFVTILRQRFICFYKFAL